MRQDGQAFAFGNSAQSREPRLVFSVDFGGDDKYFLTSHEVAGLSGANVIDGILQNAGGTSQRLNPDKANAEIGSISFDVLDAGLTALQRDKLADDKGLKGKTVAFYVGWDGLPWDDFILATTQIVDEVKYKNRAYTFRCADVQRQMRKDILEPVETTLQVSLSVDASEIEVYSTEGFQVVQHPDYDDAAFGGQKIGLLKIEDSDSFEIASYTGISGNKFTGVTRGLLNTAALAVDKSSDTSKDNSPKVTEFIFLEMPGPMAAYAILTGSIYGYPGEYLPDHWNTGISAEFVRTTDFLNIGSDLWDPNDSSAGRMVRLQDLDGEDGKKFVEEEILLLLGCYPPIYSDGQIGLRRMGGLPANGSYIRVLDADNVVSYGDLTFDMSSVINQIALDWNYDIFRKETTRRNFFYDSRSIERHGAAKAKNLVFRGLSANRATDNTLREVVSSIRERYAGPPLRMMVTLTPDQNDLEVGDVIRVKLDQVSDYTGEAADGTLDRNFEIQRVQVDWKTGRVAADLFGSSEEATPLPSSGSGVAVADEAYERGTEISPANFPGAVEVSGGKTTITGSIDFAGAPSVGDALYWCGTDLDIDADVTINDNVGLLVRGFLQVNGEIDGRGRGHPGGDGCDNIATASGSRYSRSSRWDAGNLGYDGFIDSVLEPQGGLLYSLQEIRPPRDYIYHLDGQSVIDGVASRGQIPPGETIPEWQPLKDGAIFIPDDRSDLRGGSGAGGGTLALKIMDQSVQDGTVNGGAGGAGGAGLMVICRGMALGALASINLSGADAQPGGQDSFDAVSTTGGDPNRVTWYAGSGAPGGPGACYIFLDGDVTPPPLPREQAVAQTGAITWGGGRSGEFRIRGDANISSGIGPGPAQSVLTSQAFRVIPVQGEIAPQPDIPPITENPASVTIAELTNTPRSANANLSTIEVAIEPPGVSSYKYAVVEYREKGEQGWFEVGPASPEVGFVVPSDGKTYEIRARGVSLSGNVVPDAPIQEITTTKIQNAEPGDEDVDDVVEVPNVHGLELFEQGNDAVFGGRDAKFVWRKTSVTEWLEMGSEGQLGASRGSLDLYFKDYQVEVWADGSLVRTEWVVDPAFVYTYEKNAEDYARELGQAGAWRAFECRVYCRGRQNQLSTQAAKLAVENVAPGLPQAITVSASFRSLQIDYEPPEDLDYKETRVWLSQSEGFTPGPANQVAQAYGGPVIIAGLADNTEYFLRFATYDAFGQGTMSQEFSVTTPSLAAGEVEGLSPWATVTDADKAFIDANLEDNAIEGTKIVKLTASKIVTGTLAATEKISVAGQVESVVGDAVATLGPKSADSKTGMITYQYDGVTLFAVYSDGSAAFSGAVTITGGSGYANLTDKPGSLNDISGSEYSQLNQAASDASQALSDAASAQSTADGKIQSFYQTTQPASGMSEGDLWFDTDDGNHPYRFDGSSWVDAQDSGISQALSDASNAQATANGKVTTFFSTSAPTAEGEGDLWYNDTTKVMKRWNGTSWVDTATAGADWSSNLQNIPSRLGDTPTAGLNLTATHLGYYDGTNWRAFIENDGTFYFGDGDQKYLKFDGTDFTAGRETTLIGVDSYNGRKLYVHDNFLTAFVPDDNFSVVGGGSAALNRGRYSLWLETAGNGDKVDFYHYVPQYIIDQAEASSNFRMKVGFSFGHAANGSYSSGDNVNTIMNMKLFSCRDSGANFCQAQYEVESDWSYAGSGSDREFTTTYRVRFRQGVTTETRVITTETGTAPPAAVIAPALGQFYGVECFVDLENDEVTISTPEGNETFSLTSTYTINDFNPGDALKVSMETTGNKTMEAEAHLSDFYFMQE